MHILLLFLALTATPKLEDLAWMSGHWTSTQGDVVMEEVWTTPRGGVMLGLHRDASATKASFEFIRIAATPDGIIYFAQPGGRPPTPFTLVESTQTRAVFANPKHDFPKRIIYWLHEDQLCARVEGDDAAGAEQWCWSRR